MPNFTAAQHFFTSVPSEQSPRKQRGYQTLFNTVGLSEKVVRAIEDRAQYVTAPGDPIKRQYYALPGGQFAISQIVALPELDEFGRKGRYLAHTLILDGNAWVALGGCPIDVLTQFHFLKTLAEVFAQGDPKSGGAPAVVVSVTLQWTRVAQFAAHWPPQMLEGLGRLAWQAERVLERREFVALIGAEADQLGALALIFLLAAPTQRERLSFDTQAAGCDWGRNASFLLQGFAQASEARAAHVVDARAHIVASSLVAADDSSFAVWMRQTVLPIRRLGDEQRQDWAARLAAALEPEPPAVSRNDGPIPADFISGFARLSARAVGGRWVQMLPSDLSPELGRRLLDVAVRDPEARLAELVAGTAERGVRGFMLEQLLALGDSPARGDRAALEKWIKTTADPNLNALLPLWAKDGEAWHKQMQQLPAEDYELILAGVARWRQPPLALWECLGVNHAAVWIRAAAVATDPADWKKIMPGLEKLGVPALDQLAQWMPRLSGEARHEIAKWLKGSKSEHDALRAALGVPKPVEKRGFKLF